MDIFVELIGGGFVENDGVLSLVLDCGGSGSVRVRGCNSYVPFPLDHFCLVVSICQGKVERVKSRVARSQT